MHDFFADAAPLAEVRHGGIWYLATTWRIGDPGPVSLGERDVLLLTRSTPRRPAYGGSRCENDGLSPVLLSERLMGQCRSQGGLGDRAARTSHKGKGHTSVQPENPLATPAR